MEILTQEHDCWVGPSWDPPHSISHAKNGGFEDGPALPDGAQHKMHRVED